MSVKLIKILDKHLGGKICWILGMLSKKGNEKLNRILIIQLWGIGESVLTLPSIYALMKKFPNSKIEILLTKRNKDVYYGINKLRKINLKLNPISILKFIIFNYRKYDVVIDMEEYLNVYVGLLDL